jgi:hypothetical protein
MALYFNGNKVINSLVVDGSVGAVIKGKDTPLSFTGLNGQMYLQTIKGVRQDLSQFNYSKERDMFVANYDNAAYCSYSGSGPYIGAQLYNQFDLTNIDSIEVSVKTTSPSYDNYSTERFSPILLIENTINPSSSFPVNTSIVSANGVTYRVTTQGDSATFVADVSSLTGNYWIVLSSVGATSLWSDLYLKSSVADEVIYDTFSKVNGTWQDLIGTAIEDIENISGEIEIILIDSIIPRMTSDTTPKGKCSASYVYSGRYAYYGFTTPSNGNVANANEFWYCGGNSSANNWIEYEFDKPSTILAVSFGTIENGVGKRVKVQYSNDETNWTDIKTITITTNDYTTYKLPSPVYCKYMRLFVVDNGMTVISGINAFGYEGRTYPQNVVLEGTTEPTSSQGYDGQIYLKHLPDLSSINIRESISNSAVGAYFDTGYYYNANTRIEMKVNLLGGATYPSPFGTRYDTTGRDARQMFIATYGTRMYYAFGNAEESANGFFTLNSDMVLKTQGRVLQKTQEGMTAELVTYAYNSTPVASMYLFGMNLNGSPWADAFAIMTLYYCKIFEGDTLVHYYLPALDGSDVPCLYDCIMDDYIYNLGTGTLTVGNAATVEKSTTNAYVKVNGTWQDLIGTDIEDIGATQAREPLYSLDQSQGGAWIDTGIAVSGITAFSFVNSDTGVANCARSIATSDIPVKTGSSDVYLTVFTSSWIGKDFNIRIYNGNLYVSFNNAGSSSKEVSIYAGSLND